MYHIFVKKISVSYSTATCFDIYTSSSENFLLCVLKLKIYIKQIIVNKYIVHWLDKYDKSLILTFIYR